MEEAQECQDWQEKDKQEETGKNESWLMTRKERGWSCLLEQEIANEAAIAGFGLKKQHHSKEEQQKQNWKSKREEMKKNLLCVLLVLHLRDEKFDADKEMWKERWEEKK